MKKLFCGARWLSVLLIGLSLLCSLTAPLYATREPTAIFWGAVTLEGKNVPINSIVTVSIDDLEWTCGVHYDRGYTYYDIVIPRDSGEAIKDGGIDHDIVHFAVTINGLTYLDSDTDVFYAGKTKQHPIVLKTSPVNPVNITTERLEDGVTGCAYTAQFQAEGGTLPYSWSGANLPDDLEISSGGTLSGIPLTAGTYDDLMITVSDSSQPSQNTSEYFSIVIWDLGDADHSGIIDWNDVLYAMKIYLGLLSYTPSADIDSDGDVDLQDAVKIQLLPGYSK